MPVPSVRPACAHPTVSGCGRGTRREYPLHEMSLALIIVVIAITALTAVGVIGLFLWGAVKDGEDNDAIQASIRRLRLPRRPG